jgi:hypothetical protein
MKSHIISLQTRRCDHPDTNDHAGRERRRSAAGDPRTRRRTSAETHVPAPQPVTHVPGQTIGGDPRTRTGAGDPHTRTDHRRRPTHPHTQEPATNAPGRRTMLPWPCRAHGRGEQDLDTGCFRRWTTLLRSLLSEIVFRSQQLDRLFSNTYYAFPTGC